MTIPAYLGSLLRPVALTHGRIAVGLTAAIAADCVQLLVQTIPFAPQLLDVIAMVIVTAAIGFHILFLPSFVIELIPIVDDLPTWTMCVIAVLALRRSEIRKPVIK